MPPDSGPILRPLAVSAVAGADSQVYSRPRRGAKISTPWLYDENDKPKRGAATLTAPSARPKAYVQPTKRYVVILPPKESAVPPKQAAPKTREQQKAAEYAATYWYDPRIHNWGNIGLRGFIHAFFAPLATYVIDQLSYSGVDARKLVHAQIAPGSTVLDLCCGTGFSTFKGATGVDTSPEMLAVARFRRPDAKFAQGNAETYGDTDSYDVVSLMFATHEMPAAARRRVIRNAMRVARRTVLVADIDPDFHETLRAKPMEGATFLSGEPYVLNYLSSMDDDVASCASSLEAKTLSFKWRLRRKALLPKHVVMWRLDKAA